MGRKGADARHSFPEMRLQRRLPHPHDEETAAGTGRAGDGGGSGSVRDRGAKPHRDRQQRTDKSARAVARHLAAENWRRQPVPQRQAHSCLGMRRRGSDNGDRGGGGRGGDSGLPPRDEGGSEVCELRKLRPAEWTVWPCLYVVLLVRSEWWASGAGVRTTVLVGGGSMLGDLRVGTFVLVDTILAMITRATPPSQHTRLLGEDVDAWCGGGCPEFLPAARGLLQST